jgi:BirA family biotin operon repressor/biotin-[acetyl-CoA-carboxylase] ligase
MSTPQISTLAAPAIAQACRSAAAARVAIEVVDATGSTNADLLARIAMAAGAGGIDAPLLLVARRQTAGRGRAGRAWQSGSGSLAFSLAWRFQQPLSALVGLPLAVGVAVADVLSARGIEVGLKWPNDVLWQGRKLAGILIETTATSSLLRQDAWAVIGIGINIAEEGESHTTAGDALAAAIANAPAGPAGAGTSGIAVLPATDRNLLLAQLLDALAETLGAFGETGFAPWVARWNAMHAHAGQMVDLVDRAQAVQSGRALGIDALGRLLLETPGGTIAIMAGDVSLRPVRVTGEADDAAAD